MNDTIISLENEQTSLNVLARLDIYNHKDTNFLLTNRSKHFLLHLYTPCKLK